MLLSAVKPLTCGPLVAGLFPVVTFLVIYDEQANSDKSQGMAYKACFQPSYTPKGSLVQKPRCKSSIYFPHDAKGNSGIFVQGQGALEPKVKVITCFSFPPEICCCCSTQILKNLDFSIASPCPAACKIKHHASKEVFCHDRIPVFHN